MVYLLILHKNFHTIEFSKMLNVKSFNTVNFSEEELDHLETDFSKYQQIEEQYFRGKNAINDYHETVENFILKMIN